MFRLSKGTVALCYQISRLHSFKPVITRIASTSAPIKEREERIEYSTQGFSIRCPPNTTIIDAQPETKLLSKLLWLLLGLLIGFVISDAFHLQLQYTSPTDIKVDFSLGQIGAKYEDIGEDLSSDPKTESKSSDLGHESKKC